MKRFLFVVSLFAKACDRLPSLYQISLFHFELPTKSLHYLRRISESFDTFVISQKSVVGKELPNLFASLSPKCTSEETIGVFLWEKPQKSSSVFVGQLEFTLFLFENLKYVISNILD